MEVVVNYPFEYNGYEFHDKTGVIGNFNNSTWSFAFQHVSGYHLKIIRSNPSQSFVVISNFRTSYSARQHSNKCYVKYINDGEANVLFPFKTILFPFNISLSLSRFSGFIIILQLPASNVSLTERIPPSVEKTKPLQLLSEDFLGLLNNTDSFPDATLKCGAEEILVHKGILSARSPVFAAMFKNEMREASSRVAEIVDIEPNVLQATLKYVYSSQTDHLDDGIAGNVLFAANKYQLEELKKVCIDKLKSSMTVNNVFRILVLGHLHDEGLKSQAKEFVCKCDTFSNLEKTEGWKLLQSENPGLAMEVVVFALKYAQLK